MIELWRIDPSGCWCTGCLIGESKSLDLATDDEVLRMLRGELTNATGWDDDAFTVTIRVTRPGGGTS